MSDPRADAIDTYSEHVKKIGKDEGRQGYDGNERTLLVIGFGAGWDAATQAAQLLHLPTVDEPGSLIDWTFCSCGAMEVRTTDGEAAIAPVRYPCATLRALGVE